MTTKIFAPARAFAPALTLALALVLAVAGAAGCDGDGDGDEACTPRAATVCQDGVTYWVDACGGQEEAVETCACGCDTAGTRCRECACEPACDGRACGSDGCGGECPPGCGTGEACGVDGTCAPCTPLCAERECGPDGCGGSCGLCPVPQVCLPYGLCEECTPDCTGRACGADGCGGTCPPGCAAGEACRADGTCEPCTPDCTGRACGTDGCGGTCAPGCGGDQRCDDGQCVGCTRDCTGRVCGDDGCDGSCGACGAGQECTPAGQCAAPVCGDAAATVTGAFRNGVADVTFDTVAVTLAHKRDVDAFEDGCLLSVALRLGRGEGCRLEVAAGGRYTRTGGLLAGSVRFVADSFCPGFSDEQEGEYLGAAASLERAEVVPGVTDLPGTNVAESCVATTFTLRLEGALVRADGAELAVPATELVVGGEFPSAGDTEGTCPCRPTCEGRTCGDDGCGDVCGACEGEARCTAAGQCETRPENGCWDGAAFRQKAAPGAGDVVITEYMADPDRVPDADGEWFEVWLARDVDLNGLTLGRDPAAQPDVRVPEGDCLPAQGQRFLLFARSADPAANGGLPPVLRTVDFSLVNTNGRLFVGYGAAILDVVTWTGVSTGSSRTLEPTTFSTELNDDPFYWCDPSDEEVYGAGDRGTPGAANPSCGVALPTCLEGGTPRAKVVPQAGDLVVTEIMPDPTVVSDGAGEWFEVYVGRAVDLNGLQVGRDALLVDPLIPEGACVRVAAGTHLLFARSAAAGTNGGLPFVDATFDFSVLQSDGVLRVGFGGSDLDVARWATAPEGAAWQLDPAFRTPAGNDDAGHWCAATAPYGAGSDRGTPGGPNGACD